MIKRYIPAVSVDSVLRQIPYMKEEDSGGYVNFEDVEALQKERNELAAHVARLREALYELHTLKLFASEHTVKYTPKVFDTAEAETEYKNRKPLAWANARRALASYPAQSLTHIQAQVEEETIDSCLGEVAESDTVRDAHLAIERMPRKYPKEGE